MKKERAKIKTPPPPYIQKGGLLLFSYALIELIKALSKAIKGMGREKLPPFPFHPIYSIIINTNKIKSFGVWGFKGLQNKNIILPIGISKYPSFGMRPDDRLPDFIIYKDKHGKRHPNKQIQHGQGSCIPHNA